MRYRLTGIQLWLDEPPEVLERRVAERLGVPKEDVGGVTVSRRSLDARRKGHPRWVIDAEVEVPGLLPSLPTGVEPVPAPEPPPPPVRAPELPPVILGAGPAGLFCAWGLLERGVRSIVVDRGKPVSPR